MFLHSHQTFFFSHIKLLNYMLSVLRFCRKIGINPDLVKLRFHSFPFSTARFIEVIQHELLYLEFSLTNIATLKEPTHESLLLESNIVGKSLFIWTAYFSDIACSFNFCFRFSSCFLSRFVYIILSIPQFVFLSNIYYTFFLSFIHKKNFSFTYMFFLLLFFVTLTVLLFRSKFKYSVSHSQCYYLNPWSKKGNQQVSLYKTTHIRKHVTIFNLFFFFYLSRWCYSYFLKFSFYFSNASVFSLC